MSATPLVDEQALPLHAARRVDQACNRFEAAWHGSPPPRVEDFVSDAVEPERSALLQELILLDVYYRKRRGETCRAADYAPRFPELEPTWVSDAVQTAWDETVAPVVAESLEVTPQRVFGDYELLEEIARGGMGVVYKARQKSLNRLVALKMILTGSLATPAELERFRTEAENAAQLDHPNIVPVYEVGEWQTEGVGSRVPYFSMKLVEGGNLAQAMSSEQWKASSTRVRQRAAQLVATLAEAVQYAHQHGILHRDLKPSNVLLQGSEALNPVPFVTDFGLAKRIEGGGGQTHSGAIVGTPSYMAPEQAAGQGKRLTTAADVYALGAILYELLAGRPPFKADTPLDTLMLVMHQDAVPPSRLRPGVPHDLETICLKCLEKDPSRRYISAAALAEDLRRFLAHEPVAARPVGTFERFERWCRRKPALAATTSALAVAVVIGLVGILWQWREARVNFQDSEFHRALADERERKAHDAIEDYFTRVSENTLLGKPGMQELRKELLESALRYYEEFLNERRDDPKMQAELAAAQVRVGLINEQVGATEASRESYRSGRELYSNLVLAHPGDVELERRLAQTYLHLGQLDHAAANLEDAAESLDEARTILERLTGEHPDATECLDDLAKVYGATSAVLHSSGRNAQAIEQIDKARDIHERLIRTDPAATEPRRKLAADYQTIGAIHIRTGNFNEAVRALTDGCAVLQEGLARQTDAADLKAQWAVLCVNLGIAHRNLDNPQVAANSYQQAVDLLEPLVHANPAVTDYQWTLAKAYYSFAILNGRQSNFREAIRLHMMARPYVERLIRVSPDVRDYQDLLANVQLDIGHYQSQIGEQAAALRAFQDALAVMEPLANKHPDVLNYQRALGTLYHNCGNELRRTGRIDEARQSFERCCEVRERLAKQHPDVPVVQSDLVYVYNKLGSLHNVIQPSAEARRYCELAVSACQKLVDTTPEPAEYRQLLASTLANAGNLEQLDSQLDQARAYYLRALTIRTALADSQPRTFDIQKDMATNYRDLGDVEREAGELDTALANYDKAIQSFLASLDINAENLDAKSGLAQTWDSTAQTLDALGRHAESIAAYQRAIDYQAESLGKAPEYIEYRERLSGHYEHLARLQRQLARPADALASELQRQKLQPEQPDLLVRVACGIAQCIALVDNATDSPANEPQAERERYAELAIAALRAAVEHGFNDAEKLGREPSLEPLRPRGEFHKLLSELAAKGKP